MTQQLATSYKHKMHQHTFNSNGAPRMCWLGSWVSCVGIRAGFARGWGDSTPPPGQKSDSASKSWTNVLGGCKLTPQETTQRLCSLLMLLVLSTDAAILIDRFVLLLSDAYCATFMQCDETFRDFSLPGIFAPRSESSHWEISLRGAKIRGAKSPDTP